MKREINDNYVYLVLSPMEYAHIKTLLDMDMYEVDDNDAVKCDLIYINEALNGAYFNFLKNVDLEGGDEDEDEQ
jgi:hypothetical protein